MADAVFQAVRKPMCTCTMGSTAILTVLTTAMDIITAGWQAAQRQEAIPIIPAEYPAARTWEVIPIIPAGYPAAHRPERTITEETVEDIINPVIEAGIIEAQMPIEKTSCIYMQ